MNSLLIKLFFIMLLAVSGCSQSQKAASGHRQDLEAAEVKNLLTEKNDLVILDVRTPEEFASGHVNGAVNVDFYAPDFIQKLSELNPEKTYLIYCASGNRSGKTTIKLKENGFKNVLNSTAGFSELNQAGIPVK